MKKKKIWFWLVNHRNLDEIDSECAELDYILEHRNDSVEYVMNNNFAFGGINTSLIFSKI